MTTAIQKYNLQKQVPHSVYSSYVSPKKNETFAFDPSIHLAFRPDDYSKTSTTTFAELGIPYPPVQPEVSDVKEEWKSLKEKPPPLSPIAYTSPFPLFTKQACEIMKQEILGWENFQKFARFCPTSTSKAAVTDRFTESAVSELEGEKKGFDCTIRGYAKHCPFTYAAWTNEYTINAIEGFMGREVEIVMDYEIGHVNVSIKTPQEHDKISNPAESLEDEDAEVPAVVGWHRDSYPLVCVLMISMTASGGGETYVRLPTGEVLKLKSPGVGYAVLLQGRILEHLASKPKGTGERITMVTSFRPKKVGWYGVEDTCVLSTVRPERNWGSGWDIYNEWIDWRMDTANELIGELKSMLQDSGDLDKETAVKRLKGLEGWIARTWMEMVDEK